MLCWIVGSGLKYRLLAIPVIVVMTFFGLSQLRDAPVDVFPEFTPPYVEIQTEALGLSAVEVEQLITSPMEENLLNGVAWLDEIRSESVPGLSSIELIFEPGADVLQARQMVQERLVRAGVLPNVSKPPVMLQPLSSTSRVMMIGLSSAALSPIEMSVLARWKMKPRLMGVPGVANVAIWGQREQQLQVQVDPRRLQEQGVTLSQVIKTTGNALWVSPLTYLQASTPGTGGFVESPSQRLGIQHILPIRNPADLAKVTLADQADNKLALGDVATVKEDHQPLIGDSSANGAQNLILVVEKFPGFNVSDVSRQVEEALTALRPGLTGVEVDSNLFRPATFVESAIDNISLILLIGLVLMVALLGGLLRDWRVAVISLVASVLSLLTAGLVLHLTGTAFNTLILAGLVIAIGALVDDVIVDVGQIRQRLRDRVDDESTAKIVLTAVLETRGALLYATLIALAATIPVFFVGGLSASFFQPLVIAYGIALLSSLVVASLVTPGLALMLYRRASSRHADPRAVTRLRDGYGRLLGRFNGSRRWLFATVGVLLVAGAALLPSVLGGSATLPVFKDRNLLISWAGAPGASRQEMNRITTAASNEIRAVPGVRSVGAHVGRAVGADQVVGMHDGQLWVSIEPDADYDQTLAAITNVVDGYPGQARTVRPYPQARVAEVDGDGDHPLAVRVFGKDLDILRDKASEVRDLLSKIDGVEAARLDLPPDEPTVEIKVDLLAAQRHGITPGEVRRAETTLLSGLEVGNLFEEQKVFEVIVAGVAETRHSLTSLRELLIDKPGGGQVRLGDVAEVDVKSTPTVLRHSAISRRVDVVADINGRDADAVLAEVRAGLAGITFPAEYHVEVLGRHANPEASPGWSWGLTIAVVLGIFLLLQAAFASWRLASIVTLTLPLALVGGALAGLVLGGLGSLTALTGLLAVLAISARNSILLVKHLQRLEHDKDAAEEPLSTELVLRGARERFVPVLTTTLVVAVALLPLVIVGDIPGTEIVGPITVVILGGLITSALVNLFVVPALYLRYAAGSRPDPDLETDLPPDTSDNSDQHAKETSHA